ncbi:hypothetical protein [Arabiibacter massiliensis]|uniref:hypothetical protein n=1 Tax=Arabiibacter massiliensis TaxID=1870985 RepID=UPI0009BC5F9D|nr:hypothetical protein [Arabiibacter massiliensis]
MDLSAVAGVIGTFASDILITYAWIRLLHMRSNVLFLILLAPFMLFVLAARNEIGATVRLLFLIMGSGVIPFAVATDGVLRRLLVVALVNVCIIVAELVSISSWYLMTGLEAIEFSSAWSNLGAYTFTHVMHLIILAVLFAAIDATLKRFDSDQAQGLQNFVWFPVAQALMLALALACGVYLRQGSDVLYFGTAVLSLLCLAADFALMTSAGRFARKRREDQRAALLQQHLDECLAQCDTFVEEAERTAKMRHDVRNQAHAALALAERGDLVRAREHVAAFGASLAKQPQSGEAGYRS